MKKIVNIIIVFTLICYTLKGTAREISSNDSTIIDTCKIEHPIDTSYNPRISEEKSTSDQSWKNTIISDLAYPLLLLLIGVGIDRAAIFRQQNKSNKEETQKWKFELKSIEKNITVQLEQISNYQKTFCQVPNEFRQPQLKNHIDLDLNNLQLLNINSLAEYCSKYGETQLPYDINQLRHSLKQTNEYFNKQYFKSMSEISKHIDSYNLILQSYHAKLYVCERSGDEIISDKESRNTLAVLYKKYILDPMPDINLFEIEETFVIPSLKILEKTNILNTQELYLSLQGCLNETQALKNEKKYIEEALDYTIEAYQQIQHQLESINSALGKI